MLGLAQRLGDMRQAGAPQPGRLQAGGQGAVDVEQAIVADVSVRPASAPARRQASAKASGEGLPTPSSRALSAA